MNRSLEIIRPISGKHGCLLKFFWNLNEQVAWDNETNFRKVWTLAKILLEFKGAGCS
jgi:hypothetical protein